jgi:hypothetical protein
MDGNSGPPGLSARTPADGTAACCATGNELMRTIRQAPATVVAVRRLAVAALFPADLASAVCSLPYAVGCVVATPQAAAEAGVATPVLGETLVFSRASLIARLVDAPESGAVRLCAILNAGLSPHLGRGAPSWDSDESDAYTISGRRLVASLAQVGEAWERRLLDPPNDRNGRA